MKKQHVLVIVGLLAFALIAAACSSTVKEATSVPETEAVVATEAVTEAPKPTEAPAATEAPVETEAMTATEDSNSMGAEEVSFDATAAEEEGYWYSRYNLGNLVMRSGLGETFMPEQDMMMAMIKMVDADPEDGDTVTPPMNVALLKSVYASGDPHYITQLDPADFGTQRWDPASFDTNITSLGMGWTIIKESEWAKQFHVDSHFGTPQDSFGAQWRFVGMALNAESKMQSQYALEMMMNSDGLFPDSNGNLDYKGQWVMLEAFSDVGQTLGFEAVPHSESNRYNDPKASGMFLGAADNLFTALDSRVPEGVQENSLAIQALTWYAATTPNADGKAQAIDKIATFGDALIAADKSNATDNAYAIRGLVEAYRVTDDAKYKDAAAESFKVLSEDYNPETGIFESQNTYTIDDVAIIMGSLNSSRLFIPDAVDNAKVEDMFTMFFNHAVNKSGLQQSVPPIAVAKGAFEQEEPPIYYGYPTIPMPPMAGGEFGIAPVFATEVSWDGSGWSVTDGNFDSAGAMHASNEFIWFHNDEVNGFPELP